MSYDDIGRRFTYHPPTPERAATHAHIREQLEDVSRVIGDVVPAGRERSLALAKLEEAMFWANAGLARPPALDGQQEITDTIGETLHD